MRRVSNPPGRKAAGAARAPVEAPGPGAPPAHGAAPGHAAAAEDRGAAEGRGVDRDPRVSAGPVSAGLVSADLVSADLVSAGPARGVARDATAALERAAAPGRRGPRAAEADGGAPGLQASGCPDGRGDPVSGPRAGRAAPVRDARGPQDPLEPEARGQESPACRKTRRLRSRWPTDEIFHPAHPAPPDR